MLALSGFTTGLLQFRPGQERRPVSDHFDAGEFKSRSGAWSVHPSLLEGLDALRDYFGHPVVITSGDRGEVPNHVGFAADFYVWVPSGSSLWPTVQHGGRTRVEPETVAAVAYNLGFGGVGLYWATNAKHVHVDVRHRRTWDNRSTLRKRARPFRFGESVRSPSGAVISTTQPVATVSREPDPDAMRTEAGRFPVVRAAVASFLGAASVGALTFLRR